MNWKQDVSIDENNLVFESQRHQDLVIKYGELMVDAECLVDTLSEQLDAKKALAFVDIKSNPMRYGLDEEKKATDAWVKAQVSIHPDVVEKNEEYLGAVKKMKMLRIVNKALDTRQKNLSNIVKLWLNKYYASDVLTSTERMENLHSHPEETLNNFGRKWGRK